MNTGIRAGAVALAAGACVALLAGCGGGSAAQAEASGSQSDSPAATTSSAPAATATAPATEFSEADRFVCENFVAAESTGRAYGWLTTLERDGTISGDLSTPGYLDVYTLGGVASTLGGIENPALNTAMQDVATAGTTLRAQIDGQGKVSPTPLRQALDDAAVICTNGGVQVSWYQS